MSTMEPLLHACAGASLGLGIGIGSTGLVHAARDDRWRWRWLLWPQLGLVVAATLWAYLGEFSARSWLSIPGTDKLLHLLAFGGLAFGTHFLSRGRRWHGLPVAVAIPLAFAFVEELAQAASPHRTADPIDLVADFVGLVLFWRLAVRISGESGTSRYGTSREG